MKYLAVLSILAVSACASSVQGSSQTLNVTTVPAGVAECTAQGSDYSTKFASPGSVTIKRSKYPVVITCNQGGITGSTKALSDITGLAYAGAVFTTAIGAGVDSATGAANEYPANIVVTMGQNNVVGATSMNSNADFNK